jgi:hypothetical protein
VVVKKPSVTQSAKAAPRRDVAKKTFTMRHLWRMTLWGATAACALLLAVLSTRSEVGSQRIAAVFTSAHGRAQLAARSFDAQAETRRLAAAVQDLTAQNGALKSRLAAIEQNMDDITGSVTRQIEAVKAETAPPWPAEAAPEPVTPAIVASIVNPTLPPPAGLAAPLPSPVAAAAPPAGEAATPASTPSEYGVDVGSALSIEVLRARWLGIRSAHAQLFAGLTPTVVVREIPKTKRAELRLVVGPLPSSAAAAQICAALVPYRLFCQPTVFDRQHLALQ